MILTFEDIKSSHALPIPLSHQALGEHWWYPGFGRAHPRRAGMWRGNNWVLKQNMPYGMQKLRPSYINTPITITLTVIWRAMHENIEKNMQ